MGSISRIQRATLTCLCLYSIRQATIWVDMIAEDLFAAVRDKNKNKDYDYFKSDIYGNGK